MTALVAPGLDDFYRTIEHQVLSKSELVDYFVYYLTCIAGRPYATRADIDGCFDACHIDALRGYPLIWPTARGAPDDGS